MTASVKIPKTVYPKSVKFTEYKLYFIFFKENKERR